MRARLDTVRFLTAMLAPPTGAAPGPAVHEGRVRAGGERLRARRYGPARGGPLVLALHGLSPKGLDDARMDRVCRALARAGRRVLAPELPDTARLRIGTADRDRLLALLDPEEGEPPSGIFAASFSASMALGAVAERPAGVRAVCAVGAAGDMARTVRHLLDAPGADPYGRVLLFRNFGADDTIAPALDRWLAEDALGARRPGFEAARARLPAEAAALVDDIVAGGPRAAARVPLVLARAAPTLVALDVGARAAGIRAHVALIHGAGDRVIPPAESVGLAATIRDSRLCVTPLLTHGDARLTFGAAREAPPLFRAFEGWFAALGAV